MTDLTRGADLGTVEYRDGVAVLHYRRRLPHPRAKVWRAMTEAEHLAQWFPTTIEGALEAGAPLTYAFPRGRALEAMEGQMLAFDPPSRLEMEWGGDTLCFVLQDDGTHTVLDLTVTFDELGKGARDGAGWHVCLDELTYALAGTATPWTQDEHWRALHPSYVAALGPEASTIGPPPEWEDQFGTP